MIISANFYFQLFTLTFCKPQIYFELLRIENNYGKFEVNKRNLQRNLRKRHLVKIMQTSKIVHTFRNQVLKMADFMLKRKDVEFMGILGSSPLIVTSSFEESSMEHGALFVMAVPP